MTDSAPSSVSADGGVFIAHVCGLNVLVDQYGCFGLSGHQAAIEKLVHHPETKNPACFAGEQGSRKVDDLCEILNYLLASLVRSSFAELGRVLVAWTPNPNPGLPMRADIPAQRNHEVVCECFGYVLNEVIGA
ncbi:MAG: hypothetical protein WCF18_00195 [Chthoniobacteraceae bacterium]